MKKNSHNLEIVSDGGQLPEEKQGFERRRLPRLNLSGEQFRLARNGRIYSVTDLSPEGMALRVLEQADFGIFPIASELEGTLNLRGEKHSIRARVRHLGSEHIGCEFEGLSVAAKAGLSKFLDPSALGHELKPIPSSESGTLWFHGPSGTDLLVKRGEDGSFKRMTLYVLGSYIQWVEDTGLTTGRAEITDEHSEIRGVLRFETRVLKADPVADQGKLSVAKTLILCSNVDEDFKQWCLRHLMVTSDH